MKTIVKPSATAANLAKEPTRLASTSEACGLRDFPCGRNTRS